MVYANRAPDRWRIAVAGPSHGPAVARRIWPSDHGTCGARQASSAKVATRHARRSPHDICRPSQRWLRCHLSEVGNEGDRLLGPLHTAARALRIAHCAGRHKVGRARNTCIGDSAPGCPVRRAYVASSTCPRLPTGQEFSAYGLWIQDADHVFAGGPVHQRAPPSRPASSGPGGCLSPRCCDVVRCRRADDRRLDPAPGEDVQVHSLSVSDAIHRSRQFSPIDASCPSLSPLPHHSARHHGPECPLGFGTRVARLGLLAPRPDRPVLTKNLVIARMVRTFERQDLATHSRGSDFVRNHDPNRGIESFRQRDRLVVKARTRVNAV